MPRLKNTLLMGKKLFHIRIDNSKSLVEMADIMGVSYQQIQKYEKDINTPSFPYLILFCKEMSVDFNTFLSEDNVVLNYPAKLLGVLKLLSFAEQTILADLLMCLRQEKKDE